MSLTGSVRLRLQFLGTGTSFGVPQIGCDCEVCRSDDPRDKRLRSSLWVRGEAVSIVIDTTPDFRYQCLRADIDRVDAIFFTHHHADHFFGLDDARVYNRMQGSAIPVFLPAYMVEQFEQTYGYTLTEWPDGITRPRFELRPIDQQECRKLVFDEISVTPVIVNHGTDEINGYVIETARSKVAYLTDCKTLPPATVELVQGADVVILGALWNRDWQHPSHLNLAGARELAAELQGAQTWLTHLTHYMDLHAETSKLLSGGVQLAYDDLVLEVE